MPDAVKQFNTVIGVGNILHVISLQHPLIHELVVIFYYFVRSLCKTKAGFIKIITQVINQDVDLHSSGNIELFSQLIPFNRELINNSAVIARKDLMGKEEVKVSKMN